MFEIEQKFPVSDRADLEMKLGQLGAVMVSRCVNADTYYNHPCRDFAQSGEALRVRREDGVPSVTYKAAKIADDVTGSSAVKAREELEWRLDPGDHNGEKTEALLNHLGFHRVATVTKTRCTYRLERHHHPVTVTIDDVQHVGLYAEVECVAPITEASNTGPSASEIAELRELVRNIAAKLGLRDPEPRSYLRLLLAQK